MQNELMTATTFVDAEGLQAGDEAGMTLYQIHDGHSDIVIGREEDGRLYVTLRHTIKSLVKEEPRKYIDNAKQFLRIQTVNPERISFLSGENLYDMRLIGDIDAPLLSTEVVGGFTGAIIGIYATGRGYSDFYYLDYR